MSKETVFGYEVASAQQQRRTALIIVAVIVFILTSAAAAFILPSLYRHYTYTQTEGTVADLEIQCQYKIRSLSKRGTGPVFDLMDCATARAEAAKIDHPLGEIREIAIVGVDYLTADGQSLRSSFMLPAGAARDLQIGGPVAIEYDPDDPSLIQRTATNNFALTHESRYGLEESEGAEAQSVPAPAETKVEVSETVHAIASVIAWVIVALMLIAPFAIGYGIWRWLRRGKSPKIKTSPVAASRIANVTATRAAMATRRRASAP
ncbi:MAG: hypothetical protein R3D57_07570 [Hyphomicrobiaceae bacterium]